MGVGSGIFLIAIGAILTFALRANVWWIDVRAVGWVFILAGLAVLLTTLWFWQDRASGLGPSSWRRTGSLIRPR